MQIELLNVYSFFLCCVLPIFIIIAFILIVNIRARWKGAIQTLRNLSKENINDRSILPVPRRYIPIYVIASLIMIEILMCATVFTIVYYFENHLVGIVNVEILRIIILTVLLLAILMTLVALLLKRTANKNK